MATRAHRRPKPRTVAQITGPPTAPTKDLTMTQQPQPPAVLIETDETLRRMWAPHDVALADAQAAGGLAKPFERDARTWRADAQAERQKAARAEEEAAKLEAAAVGADRDAIRHRQDEAHLRQVAYEIAQSIEHLRAISNRRHPVEIQQLMEQQAAANAVAESPLTAPIDSLVSGTTDPSMTAPIAAVEAK